MVYAKFKSLKVINTGILNIRKDELCKRLLQDNLEEIDLE